MANIMVVDDEEAIIALMRMILERCGHKVFKAGNGEEALKALGVEPSNPSAPLPDIMVLDLMMPIVDGYTVAITMKDDPRTQKIPILVVTAKSDMRAPLSAIPQVAGFFDKPFNPKQLIETIDKILAKKTA